MRILFFGSDDFAAVCLKELLNSSLKIAACISGPDTRQGRGMKVSLSPIKEIALDHNITCLQPESLKDPGVIEELKSFQADVFVVVAYGRILPQAVLDIPKLFCVNVHGSLLPQYRGAAPVNWAIINGDKQTGVTVQKMALQLDAGDIISQEAMPILLDMTADILRMKMADVGAKLLVKTLKSIADGKYSLKAQDEFRVTVASKLTKEMGKIHWNESAEHIEHLIRGLKPWPGTYTTYKGKMLKVLEAAVASAQGQAGTVIEIQKQGFVIGCGEGSLLIKNVQPEGGKPMSAYDFVLGSRLALKDQLI